MALSEEMKNLLKDIRRGNLKDPLRKKKYIEPLTSEDFCEFDSKVVQLELQDTVSLLQNLNHSLQNAVKGHGEKLISMAEEQGVEMDLLDHQSTRQERDSILAIFIQVALAHVEAFVNSQAVPQFTRLIPLTTRTGGHRGDLATLRHDEFFASPIGISDEPVLSKHSRDGILIRCHVCLLRLLIHSDHTSPLPDQVPQKLTTRAWAIPTWDPAAILA